MLLDSNKFTLKMNFSFFFFWLLTLLPNRGRIYILNIHASQLFTWIVL